MTGRPNYQMLFMEKIKALLSPQQALADVLADLLCVSKDSAYRRIRCETDLTLDEVLVICEHFRITFESLSNPNAVIFQFKQLKPEISSFREYLANMLNDLERIKSFENAEIIYAAEDIPVFHHFPFPLLSSFKTYYWMRSIMNVKAYEGTRFTHGLIEEDVLELGRQIHKTYLSIPSAEIWTDGTISSTLNQIEYYWEAGLFESAEVGRAVCDEFIQELQGIQNLCEMGSKQHVGFRFYHNDIMIGNNCILIKAGTTRFCYLSHHSFNFMLTTDFAFSGETESWLDNMMKRSMLISGVSEKQRNIFFSQLIKKVENAKEQMR
jgi:hypothetical protein